MDYVKKLSERQIELQEQKIKQLLKVLNYLNKTNVKQLFSMKKG